MKLWLSLFLAWLFLMWSALGDIACADPLTFTTMRVVPTTLHAASQDFALLTDLNEAAATDVQITVTDPVRAWAYLIPAGSTGAVLGLQAPRVYKPTTFSADLTLETPYGVLDQRRVEWTTSTPVPEPATVGLLAWGLGIIVWTRRRRA